VKVNNVAELKPDLVIQIESELAAHRSLQDVLNWSKSQPAGALMPQVIEDVVIQDEFTHDIIVPWRDGLVLVYDTT